VITREIRPGAPSLSPSQVGLRPPSQQSVLLFAKDGGFGTSPTLQKPGCSQAPHGCPGLAAAAGAGRLSIGRSGSLGVWAVFGYISVPGMRKWRVPLRTRADDGKNYYPVAAFLLFLRAAAFICSLGRSAFALF